MIAQFLIVFKDYLIEVLPFLAIGFFLSGLIHEFVPSGWVERHLGGKEIKPLLYPALVESALPIRCFGSLPVAVSLHSEEGKIRTGFSLSGGNASYLRNCSRGLLCLTRHKVYRLHILCRDFEWCFCWRDQSLAEGLS